MGLTPERVCDWDVAEELLRVLERKNAMRIQTPPLSYTDELARRGASEAGCEWYYSIEDFENALLHGILELKRTDEPGMVVSIQLTPSSLAQSSVPRPMKSVWGSGGRRGSARTCDPSLAAGGSACTQKICT